MGFESGFSRIGGPSTDSQAPTTDSLAMPLYPNPATDHVSVRLDRAIGKGSLQVMDLSGRVFLQVQLAGAETRVDVSSLPVGM